MTATKKRIRYRIRDARSNAGLTQRQLAEKIGVQQHSISNIENGLHDPSSETLVKLCEALQCQPSDLIYLDTEA